MQYTYGSESLSFLTSAARTVATTSNDFTNKGGSGLLVYVKVTAYTSGGITVTIQGKDELSGDYYTILSGAKLQSATTQILRVAPDLTAGTGIAKDLIPHVFRVSVAVDDATSITYSIGGSLTP